MHAQHSPSDSWSRHAEAYRRGDTHYRARRYRAPLQEFALALTLWPEDSDTWWAIGNCHTELGRPRLADLAFRRDLKTSEAKNREALIYNLANALFDQRRLASAARLYQRVSSRSATGVLARRNRAKASMRARANSSSSGRESASGGMHVTVSPSMRLRARRSTRR
jgi:Flp pilus assembly protein TadD